MIRKAWFLSLQPPFRNRVLIACDPCARCANGAWGWLGSSQVVQEPGPAQHCLTLPDSPGRFPPCCPEAVLLSARSVPRAQAAAPVPLTALTERFSAWPM